MISYEVEFPTQKSFSLKINGYSSEEGLDCKTVEAIGGDVKVQVEKQTLLTVPYRENITVDFTLEGYKNRAISHAENIITKLLGAATLRAADENNVGAILENAKQNSTLHA